MVAIGPTKIDKRDSSGKVIDMFLETLHSLGTRIRHSALLERQRWIWEGVEPVWQTLFGRLSHKSGFALHVNGDSLRLSYEYAARYGKLKVYEPSFYNPFIEVVRRGAVVMDVGAHVGFFSLGAALRVGPEGKVYAFEAAPPTAHTLRRHVAMNHLEDRLEVVEAAVSDSGEPIEFYTYGDSMANSLSRVNVELLNPQRTTAPANEIKASVVKVPAVTLDSFCEERGIRPDVIKIDVEGAEHRVLLGARRLLEDRSAVIFCEIHPLQLQSCASSVDALLGYLKDLGYQVSALDTPNAEGIFHARLAPDRGFARTQALGVH